jgi:hypothetical protein
MSTMNLRRFFLTVAVVAGMVVMSHSVVFAQEVFFAVLLGGNEVTDGGEANVGDQNGFGSATVIIVGDRVCFGLVFDNIITPHAAHIHENVAGQNGIIVVDFVGAGATGQVDPPTSGNPGSVSGCVTDAALRDPSALARIRKNPGGFYVNVHNEQFGAGAIRGQLY